MPAAIGQIYIMRAIGPFDSETMENQNLADTLLAEENRILELIATGSALKPVLDALCAIVERLCGGCACSILVLDPEENRLWYGSTGNLPKEFTDAFEGFSIGPEQG